jgi:hypothetical protein
MVAPSASAALLWPPLLASEPDLEPDLSGGDGRRGGAPLGEHHHAGLRATYGQYWQVPLQMQV